MANRNQHLGQARSLVVKLGTQLLSGRDGRLDSAFLAQIARQIHELHQRNIRVTIVSSGAIGCGLGEMGIARRPTDLARLQAIAAVGQRRLMDEWAAAFSPLGLKVAQILLTREDINERKRFLNLRNTVAAIHELGAVPIINENDTISTDELVRLTFGDNDILASMVTHALQANLLILLSVVDGLLDSDGKSVRLVESIEQARQLVRTEKSALGKGGMDSKLSAAKTVTDAGDAMIVADGRMESVITRLIDGEELGTLFIPAGRKRLGKSRWIGSAQPVGRVVVDGGAVRAVGEQNKSLLPAGIVSVEGEFAPGDVVAIVDANGKTIARGLSNYASNHVVLIAGKRSSEVKSLLAEAAYDEVIHKDNLVLE